MMEQFNKLILFANTRLDQTVPMLIKTHAIMVSTINVPTGQIAASKFLQDKNVKIQPIVTKGLSSVKMVMIFCVMESLVKIVDPIQVYVIIPKPTINTHALIGWTKIVLQTECSALQINIVINSTQKTVKITQLYARDG